MSRLSWVVVALSETPLRLGLLAGLLGLLATGAALVVWLGRRRNLRPGDAIEGEDAAAAWRAEAFPATPSADGYLLQDPGWGGETPAGGDTTPAAPDPVAAVGTDEAAGLTFGQSPQLTPEPLAETLVSHQAAPPTLDWPEPVPPLLDAWTHEPNPADNLPEPAEPEFAFTDRPGWVPGVSALPLNLLDDDPVTAAVPPELRPVSTEASGDDSDSPFGQSPDPLVASDENQREAKSFREQLLNESPESARPDPRDLFGT